MMMPEFLDRIPEQNRVVFNPLTHEVKKRVYDKFMKELIPDSLGAVLSTAELKDWIIAKCDPNQGARPLRDKITEYVIDQLALVKLEFPKEVPIVAGIDLDDGEGVVKFWADKSLLDGARKRQVESNKQDRWGVRATVFLPRSMPEVSSNSGLLVSRF